MPSSDLALLALATAPQPSTHSGNLNVSYHTHEQLWIGIDTLFGALERPSTVAPITSWCSVTAIYPQVLSHRVVELRSCIGDYLAGSSRA